MRPSLLDFLAAPGAAAGQEHGAAGVVPAQVPGDPAASGAARTFMGKSWHLYLDPFNPSSCLVAILSVWEEFGRHVGREARYTVPAMGRSWQGADLDHAAIFASMERHAELVSGRPPGAFGEGPRLQTVAAVSEDRPVLLGPFPATDLVNPGFMHRIPPSLTNTSPQCNGNLSICGRSAG